MSNKKLVHVQYDENDLETLKDYAYNHDYKNSELFRRALKNFIKDYIVNGKELDDDNDDDDDDDDDE